MKPKMIYRIATAEEVSKQFDYLIDIYPNDPMWKKWKKEHVREVQTGKSIPYYGFIGDTCICEAYAVTNKNKKALFVDFHSTYLKAFRTRKEYQNQGYFSGLFHFMIDDLRSKGYTEAVVGVESTDEVNKSRYKHYGFTTYLFALAETYSDGSVHSIEYYEKQF